MHDIIHNIGMSQIAAPQTLTSGSIVSETIDMQGIGALAVAVLLGDTADTLGASVYIDLKIEHAEDNGAGTPAAFAACTDVDVKPDMSLVSGVFKRVDNNAEADTRYAVEYSGGKRFVRITAQAQGLSEGIQVAMLALAANPAQAPVDNS
ncbi:MAG TPA: hypothetical protein DIW20_06545 [Rhodospirillaceae bacterium]|nr:hypothetical protein [Rhodospirillaceae bacterium]